MIKKLDDIFENLNQDKKVVLSVAAAEDREVLIAVKDAVKKQIVQPILVGNKEKIIEISEDIDLKLDNIKIINCETMEESAEISVKLVSNNEADFVMKGLLDTSILLKSVLNKDYGLRTDSLLSHVMIYEMRSYHKLLLLTDGGMNIEPSYEQKEKILKNAIEASKPLGIENLKIACITAKEKINSKMQATLDAGLLKKACEEGKFGENVVVEGPIAFDLAVSEKACKIKGYSSPVSGDADVLLVPTIEVGNGIGKSFTYMANAKSAGIIMGAKAPIVLVSRSDSYESKLYSIAYGALISKNKNK
ncbi:MAG: bifunctional enoyl-CoA hydratase/phosphate acetyltransferase [Romboutsia sp.]